MEYKLIDFDVIKTDKYAVGVEFGGEKRAYYECWVKGGSLTVVRVVGHTLNLIYFLEPQVLTIIRQVIKEHKNGNTSNK